jgi:hypothetical protein
VGGVRGRVIITVETAIEVPMYVLEHILQRQQIIFEEFTSMDMF